MQLTGAEEEDLEQNLIQKGRNTVSGEIYYLNPTYLPSL